MFGCCFGGVVMRCGLFCFCAGCLIVFLVCVIVSMFAGLLGWHFSLFVLIC